MQAELITIGDEILIGQIVDSNSAWIAQRLNDIGINVGQITSIGDTRGQILSTLTEAEKRADVIIITGGLGPTKDDITKNTLCRFFNSKLVPNQTVLESILKLTHTTENNLNELNRMQAEVPESCQVIQNDKGTAPGMIFRKNRKLFISLPGVPYEMKEMMDREILKLIKEEYGGKEILHKTIVTQGIAESYLADILTDWENKVRDAGVKLAYLPSPGIVRLRLSMQGDDREQLEHIINHYIDELNKIIPGNIAGSKEQNIEKALADYLIRSGLTICTAESCTGGYLAHLLTSIAGSSSYFSGSVIAYQNEIKTNMLKVKPEDIATHGAVSETVVKQMAVGARELLKSDISVATSGIAGPSGGSDQKPVGTVWIGLATAEITKAKKFIFGNDRIDNIRQSAIAALNTVLKEIYH